MNRPAVALLSIGLALTAWLLPRAGAADAMPRAGAVPVPVVISASHDRALLHWQAAALGGRLPAGGNTVVHIDAHPDMGVPRCRPAAGWPERADAPGACVDIGSFQLAAVQLGLVERIIWLRPGWARQFEDAEYRFGIGVSATGEFMVDSASDYYLFSEAWAPRESMSAVTDLEFQVLEIGRLRAAPPALGGSFILDIDLDVFSTRNPGRDFLRRSGLDDEDIDDIVARFSPASLTLAARPAQRAADIRAIRTAVRSLLEGPWYTALRVVPTLMLRGVGLGDLLALYQVLAKVRPGVAPSEVVRHFELAIGLPERLAARDEMSSVMRVIGKWLADLKVRPALVTLARSAGDGFTPGSELAWIEASLLTELTDSLGDLDLHYDRDILSAR